MKSVIQLTSTNRVIKTSLTLLMLMALTFKSFGQSPVTITTSLIDQTTANTIQGHLNNGVSVVVESSGELITETGVTIAKTSGGDATLTFKSAQHIYLKANLEISSVTGKLNLVFWSNTSGTGGIVRFGHDTTVADIVVKTNGGHVWVGGGSGNATWNGLSVGNSYALGGIAASGAIPWWGLEIYANTQIFTDGGHVSINGASQSQPTTVGVRLVNSLINSGSGNIDVKTDVTGSSTNAFGLWIEGDGGFSSTSGNITFNNVIKGNASISTGLLLQRTTNGFPVIASTQGNVSMTNDLSTATSYSKWYIDIDELILTREKVQTATNFTEDLPAILSGSTSIYSSNATSVATVNNQGLVSIVGLGNSDITGVFSKNDWNSIDSRWRYKIGVVNKADPNITFAQTEVFKQSTDPNFTLTATQQNQGGGTLGAISYASSNRSVATVNATTGEVTIVGEGSTVISATSTSTVTYAQGNASYTLYVTNGLVVFTTNAINNNGIVTVSGNVVSDGGNTVTERGFVYATTSNPTISDNKVVVGSGTGTFSGNIHSLASGTYYFRAFATNSTGTVYGSEFSLAVTEIDLSTLGCINILASGGADEGTTWTYSNGTIIPNSAADVNLDVSVVLAKLALGDLTIAGKCITVDTDVNYTADVNSITLKASGNIVQNASKSITTSGGDVIFWSDSDNSGVGGIQLKNFGSTGASITTNGGAIIMGGGTDPLTDFAMANNGLTIIDSQPYGGLWLRYASLNAGGGNITLSGSNGSLVASTRGLYAVNTTIQTSGSGTITLNGDGGSSTGATNPWGINTSGTTIQTDSGDVHIYGISNRTNAGNERGMALVGFIQSVSGDIFIEDRTTSATQSNYNTNFNGIYMPVSIGKGTLASSSSNVYIKSNEIQTELSTVINTSGIVEVTPFTGETTFTNALTWNAFTTASNIAIGNSSNTADIRINAVQTSSGPIGVVGGGIAINAALTSINNDISLYASGPVTQTAAITGNGLSLNGTGAFTLNNTSNNIATLAGGVNTTKLASVSVTDASGGLTIGTIGSNSGLTVSGTILVETLADDLTIVENITTDNATANAITINAGKSVAIGTSTGGDIVISGTPTITTGTGGITKLFSGAESTALTTYVGGSANTRLGVDETTTTFSPVLVNDNAYALYRQTAIVIQVGDITINEGSDWAVFEVNGPIGDVFSLSLLQEVGEANLGSSPAIQTWNGSAWVNYAADEQLIIPNERTVYVRVDITGEQDTIFEGAETFDLELIEIPNDLVGLTIYDANFQTFNLDTYTRTGTDGAVGTTYKKVNAITINGQAIDVVISIDDKSNVSSFTFDSNSSNASRFQPEINSTSDSGSYVDFTFEFFLSGTTTKVGIKNFVVNPVDIDGSSSMKEFVELFGLSSYQLGQNSGLTVTPNPSGRTGFTRFEGINSSLGGIEFEDTASFIASFTRPVDKFKARMGLTGRSSSTSSSGIRFFSTSIGSAIGTFTQPSDNAVTDISGTATIIDNGTGDYWIGDNFTPATPSELTAANIFLDNDAAPVISDQTFTYTENQAAYYNIGDVVASDNSGTYTLTITSGNDFNYFALSSTGSLTLTSAGAAGAVASNDFETTPNSFPLEVTATDGASNTATGTITINVTDVDDTDPVILDQTFTYAENQAANYAIGTVSATDSNTLTYAFETGENPDGFFAINSSTGAISLTNVGSTSSAASNDYETTPNIFSLVVKVTDPSSNTTTGTITINVTDVSEITFGITPGQVFTYAENQAANYAIGTVTATDYIGGVTFSISSGNTAGYFALSSEGALTLTSAGAGAVASNDYETTPNSFSLGISVTDTTSTTVSGNVTINVTDIDEITDTDGDGVPDSIENLDGTDPNDGCSYVSSSVSLSPSIAWEALDCDADGLTNGEEKDLGTNPKNKDTDGDGVLDGTEVTDTTDPLDPCDYLTISITEERTSQWLNADCDKDGLTNGEEIDLGTDPFDADTDGDGVLDGTEVTDGTNPLDVCDYVSAHITQVQKEAWLNADCDKDGLTNEKEKDLGTDPFNADTDGDGVLDGTEVSDGTNPLDLCDLILSHQTLNPSDEWNATDCDEDGLSNKDEKELGTDPKNPDTDGDGVLDGTEVLDGTDPLNLCDFILSHQTLNPSDEWNAADCDEDGLTNKEEKELGTDPKNPDTDGDGVLDGKELTDNTNPLDLCDFTLSSQSVEPSSDWNNADCDYDGAKNGIEIEYGSNPLDKDTDKDGVIDGTEIIDNTDVLDNCSLILEHQTEMANVLIWNQLDCDNDSLPNGGERREDSDNDGLLNFLDSDDDNDGIPTKEEYPDANKNAFDEDAMDVNNNNIPDYLEANNFNPNEIDGIEVYNVLTPNGDGVHDIFTIRNISMYPDNEVRVYNRWGKLVYEMKGYGTNGRYFNGTSNLGAQRLSSGTYFYVLNYRDANAQNKTRQGYLYLNR